MKTSLFRAPHFTLRLGAALIGLASVGGAFAQNPQYPAYQPPAPTNTSVKLQSLSERLAQVTANDQRQDIRLYHLEKDVDKLGHAGPAPVPSYETGATQPQNLVPYTTYQVRQGDSLWRIAMNNRVSPGEIMSFNRMPNDVVAPGQVLMIPQKGSKTLPSAPAGSGMHLVQPNETYYSIAKSYRTTVASITKANPNVNPNKLQAGMRIVIPAGATAHAKTGVSQPNVAPAPVKKNLTHIVAPGESLGVIAKKYGIATASLQSANKLVNPNALRVGQQLVIPANGSPRFVTKKATPTQAARSVTSQKSNVPAAGNGLAPAPTYPGPAPKPPTAPTPPVTNNRQVVSYRLEPGDSIDTVAKDFGTSAAEIRRLNRMSTTSRLVTGDEILVPGMGAVN